MMLFPKTPPQHSALYVTRMRLMWSSLAVLLLSLLYLVVWGLFIHPKQEAWVKSYQASPGCMAVPPASSGPTPCTFVTERVAGYRSESAGSSDIRYLTLQVGNGTPREVRLLQGHDGRIFWETANVGDDVTAKVWKGDVISVSRNGHTAMAYDNPELYGSWDATVAMALLIAAVSGGIIAMFFLMNRREGLW